MKGQILKMLLETEDYVSGQKLCESFGVSRTAVWKAVNQLKEEGYEIESVTKKGYRIVSSPDLVTKEAIEGKMNTKVLGRKVVYHEVVDSTNNIAKELSEQKDSHGTLCTAEIQNGGKGRRGRSFYSPAGSGIWMSLLLKPDMTPQAASMLTPLAALAVVRGILEEEKDLDLKIKWPNDIIYKKKKLCGILTEMGAEPDCIHYVVVGIGINVNTIEFPKEIQEVATSLYLATGKNTDRSSLICRIMKHFEEYYERFLEAKSLAPFVEEYNALLVNRGEEVKVSGSEELSGTALGINETGELLVETKEGVVPVLSGEVSVRGIYGYV